MSGLVTVFQYETKDATTIRHELYRTRDSILAQGGTVLQNTARKVPSYEVTNLTCGSRFRKLISAAVEVDRA
jgi:hypothetical protein